MSEGKTADATIDIAQAPPTEREVERSNQNIYRLAGAATAGALLFATLQGYTPPEVAAAGALAGGAVLGFIPLIHKVGEKAKEFYQKTKATAKARINRAGADFAINHIPGVKEVVQELQLKTVSLTGGIEQLYQQNFELLRNVEWINLFFQAAAGSNKPEDMENIRDKMQGYIDEYNDRTVKRIIKNNEDAVPPPIITPANQ